MTNAILIGKTIYDKLKADETLNGYINGKIFPIVAEQGTSFPFIVYWRNNIQTNNYTKDGYRQDSVEFTIVVASDKYNTSLAIANQIRKIMEVRRIENNDMLITNVRLVETDESWSDNAYIQTLNFTCTVE